MFSTPPRTLNPLVTTDADMVAIAAYVASLQP
jgi:hypothetical protein